MDITTLRVVTRGVRGVKDNFFLFSPQKAARVRCAHPFSICAVRSLCTALQLLQLVTSARLHRAIVLLIHHALTTLIAVPSQGA